MKLPWHPYPFGKDGLKPAAPRVAAIHCWNGTGFLTDSGFQSTDDRFADFRISNLSDTAQQARYRGLAHAIQQRAFLWFLHPGQPP